MNWFTRKKAAPPPPASTALQQYKDACAEYDAALSINTLGTIIHVYEPKV